MPINKFWNITADERDPGTVNMYVYGEIVSASGFFGDSSDVVPKAFIDELNEHRDAKIINVFLNSPGGDVYAASAIRNQLIAHPASIHTWADGLVASAAIAILLAADKENRHMSRASLLMIHNPSTRVRGEAKDFTKAVDILNKVKTTIVDIYVTSTGLAKDVVEQMMDNETYLTADEAKEKGFISSINEDAATMDVKDDDTFTYNGVLCSFSNLAHPDIFKNKIKSLSSHINTKGGKTMTFEDILNSLTDEQKPIITAYVSAAVTEALNKVKVTQENDATAFNAQIKMLQEKVTSLEANAATPAASAEDAEIDALPENVKKIVLQAKASEKDAQIKLAKVERENKMTAFKEKMKIYDNLPIQDNHMEALFNLSTNNSELFTNMEELLKVANSAMGAGFVPKGSDKGASAADTAWAEIENKVNEKRKANKDMDYNAAFENVIRENPDLYMQYKNEN